MLPNRQLLSQLPPALIGCALAVALSTFPGSFTHLFGVQASTCGRCCSLHVSLTRVQLPTHNVPVALPLCGQRLHAGSLLKSGLSAVP